MDSKNNGVRVPKRILASLLSSVSAGVVPREGAPYIAIGRTDEIKALLSDLEAVSEGGAGMRFLVGRYGSGKSFLIQLLRGYALERGFITADADLSPERRLYGSGGSGVASYRELMKNLASKASPDAGALPQILARWHTQLQSSLLEQGIAPEHPEYLTRLRAAVLEQMKKLEFFVGGFDFSRVVTAYFESFSESDELLSQEKRSACLRWLRGEFSNKTEAKSSLGFQVSTIIDDDNWYDFLKLWAALVRLMGYRGLVVFIDECVNLYKIPNRISRENNYEKILSMFNDTLQGRAPGLELILGGTPQFLEDNRRGLFSYEALRSRLCDSRFSVADYKNLIGPVIRLRRLSDDELLALIVRVTALHEQYYQCKARISPEQMEEFLAICLARAGADSMITPREMLRDYMTVLHVLMQNEGASFEQIVGKAVTLEVGSAPGNGEQENHNAPLSTKPRFTPEDLDF